MICSLLTYQSVSKDKNSNWTAEILENMFFFITYKTTAWANKIKYSKQSMMHKQISKK